MYDCIFTEIKQTLYQGVFTT